MKIAFWWLNGGLVLMIFTSLLPIGVIQFYASVSEGMWYARSEEFMQQDILQTLRWMRTFGDVVFIIGTLAVSWQVVLGVFDRKRSTRVLITNLLKEPVPTEKVCCGSCGGSEQP